MSSKDMLFTRVVTFSLFILFIFYLGGNLHGWYSLLFLLVAAFGSGFIGKNINRLRIILLYKDVEKVDRTKLLNRDQKSWKKYLLFVQLFTIIIMVLLGRYFLNQWYGFAYIAVIIVISEYVIIKTFKIPIEAS